MFTKRMENHGNQMKLSNSNSLNPVKN